MYLRHQLGKEAEQAALEWFLVHQKSRLLARNYRCKWGEIDLIFEEQLSLALGSELVFVEVRARSPRGWVDGPQSVVRKKQLRLKRTASHFLVKYHGLAKSVRFDLLYWDGTSWVI